MKLKTKFLKLSKSHMRDINNLLFNCIIEVIGNPKHLTGLSFPYLVYQKMYPMLNLAFEAMNIAVSKMKGFPISLDMYTSFGT